MEVHRRFWRFSSDRSADVCIFKADKPELAAKWLRKVTDMRLHAQASFLSIAFALWRAQLEHTCKLHIHIHLNIIFKYLKILNLHEFTGFTDIGHWDTCLYHSFRGGPRAEVLAWRRAPSVESSCSAVRHSAQRVATLPWQLRGEPAKRWPGKYLQLFL